MKDPSCWLEAHQLENCLRRLELEMSLDVEKIAHMSAKLTAWGPLDSVLKLIGRPGDILHQPDRFLSYFVSPPPPIDLIERKDEFLSFRIPISSEEFPTVTRFLRGALESLPTYVGRNLAQAKWTDNLVSINWSMDQQDLDLEEGPGHVNPKLVTQLMHSLEKSQKEMEQKNHQILFASEEIQKLKEELQKKNPESSLLKPKPKPKAALSLEKAQSSLNALAKMSDYFVRAQQLITILSATAKGKESLAPSFRKTDWERVVQDYPRLVKELRAALEQSSSVEPLPQPSSEKSSQEELIPDLRKQIEVLPEKELNSLH